MCQYKIAELVLHLTDEEWPRSTIKVHRQIVRAIVFDQTGYFYFVQIHRDDEFGQSVSIETAGGGVEKGESLVEALKREIKEELGMEVAILCKLGVVEDDYHLICRHNINHYFLCKVLHQGERQLTVAEKERWQLSTLKLSFDQALQAYETNRLTPFGRLVSNREVPILRYAKKVMDELNL